MSESTESSATEEKLRLAPLEAKLPPIGSYSEADDILMNFMGYCEDIGLTLYPAQEEAILEIMADNNVILNTPTGSGKSLVALAASFKALASGHRIFYTAPIKALVTEKFFDLCQALGAKQVGLITGDASINRDAPVICCTAEILSNIALREGKNAEVDWVVMDEFHFYSDKERGVAWQVPLLTLPQARFLLMSATLGDTSFFEQEITQLTRAKTALVKSDQRPVPLSYKYSEKPLQETIIGLLEGGEVPVYIVHFSQRAASEQAQNLMSINVLSKDEKAKVRAELKAFRFDSPFGKELGRLVPHGIGVHHAGMLPKYRRLIERLSRMGLLKIICGTDTLGVGVNVPIRTVLFTQLCKFDGTNTVHLSVRDFHQIAGRAGRRGFDSQGTVIVQAPEHEIENLQLKTRAEGDAKKMKKLRLRKPPERGYKAWNSTTLEQLRDGTPEALQSRFRVTHGMLLNVLSRRDESCMSALDILDQCHERPLVKKKIRKEGFAMLRSLIDSKIIIFDQTGVHLSEELQDDFSLDQALSLYAVEAFASLDQQQLDYPVFLLSIVEAILEQPWVILYQQIAQLKTRKMAELKAAGVEYDERMDELQKVDYPKPESEFIYDSFNVFAESHPWVKGHSISPKSIARDMYENCFTFTQYVKEYGLGRAEGVLLRYLSSVYRTLQQNVPEQFKTNEVHDLIEWLGAELRQIDASLLDEWEALSEGRHIYDRGENADEPTTEPEVADITRNDRAFTVMIRNACFRMVQTIARQDGDGFLEHLAEMGLPSEERARDSQGQLWTLQRLNDCFLPYWELHQEVETGAAARSPTLLSRERISDDLIEVRQTLLDPEASGEFRLKFTISIQETRDSGGLVMRFDSLES